MQLKRVPVAMLALLSCGGCYLGKHERSSGVAINAVIIAAGFLVAARSGSSGGGGGSGAPNIGPLAGALVGLGGLVGLAVALEGDDADPAAATDDGPASCRRWQRAAWRSLAAHTRYVKQAPEACHLPDLLLLGGLDEPCFTDGTCQPQLTCSLASRCIPRGQPYP